MRQFGTQHPGNRLMFSEWGSVEDPDRPAAKRSGSRTRRDTEVAWLGVVLRGAVLRLAPTRTAGRSAIGGSTRALRPWMRSRPWPPIRTSRRGLTGRRLVAPDMGRRAVRERPTAAPTRRDFETMTENLDGIARDLAARGEPYVVATVVWRRSPSSGQVGSKAIVTPDGNIRGWVGGACAEPSVVTQARPRWRGDPATGLPRLAGGGRRAPARRRRRRPDHLLERGRIGGLRRTRLPSAAPGRDRALARRRRAGPDGRRARVAFGRGGRPWPCRRPPGRGGRLHHVGSGCRGGGRTVVRGGRHPGPLRRGRRRARARHTGRVRRPGRVAQAGRGCHGVPSRPRGVRGATRARARACGAGSRARHAAGDRGGRARGPGPAARVRGDRGRGPRGRGRRPRSSTRPSIPCAE